MFNGTYLSDIFDIEPQRVKLKLEQATIVVKRTRYRAWWIGKENSNKVRPVIRYVYTA